MMSTATVSLENCALEVARSMSTSFFWDCERKGCLCCFANWIDYGKKLLLCMFVFWHFSTGEGSTQQHCPGCVTAHCYHKDQVASLEEQVVDISLFCVAWLSWRGVTPNNFPTFKCCITWLHSSEYSVDQILPFPCRSGLAHETIDWYVVAWPHSVLV